MNSIGRIALVGTMACFPILTNVCVGESASSDSSEHLLNLLQSNDPEQQTKAHQRIVDQRKETVVGLREIIRKQRAETQLAPQIRSQVYHAIALLGELRAEEGIPELMDSLTFRVPQVMRWSGDEPSFHEYPAAVALAKIGRPAVDNVVSLLETTANPVVRRLCALIVVRIEGPRIAKYQFRTRLSDALPVQSKNNLQVALDFIDKQSFEEEFSRWK